MNKITFLLLLIFGVLETHAQDYQISFTGTGASMTVDSVKVENLTHCTNTILNGNDILHLTETFVEINEFNKVDDNTIQIYPNPMNGSCSVGFEATAQSATTIELYSINVEKILQVQELLSSGYHAFSISGIGSGMYFIKVESEKFLYTAKIISNNASFGIAEIKHISKPCIDKQTTESNTGENTNLKSKKSVVIDMQYTTGDRLKLTGFSGGIYRTVFMLVPTQDSTVTFNFMNCTDADSNHYAVVQIGTQIWMAENLKTTKYQNGDSINNVTDDDEWNTSGIDAYCNYLNTPSYSTTYGRLYNWFAASEPRNIAPIGWHVPSVDEWFTLTSYLGGESVAGSKLQATCTSLWINPNIGATDEAGFTALPGGHRFVNGSYTPFYFMGSTGFWWTSTPVGAWPMSANKRAILSNGSIDSFQTSFYKGYSVRCVRDL